MLCGCVKARSACAWLPLIVILSLPASADDSNPGTPVTDSSAIETLMTGNTFEGIYQETGESWVEYYCDTGKSLYDFRDRISLGKWWVLNAEVCFSYDWSAYQHVQCFNMFTKPDGSLTLTGTDEEGVHMTFRSSPPRRGDPFHLEQRASHGCRPEPSV